MATWRSWLSGGGTRETGQSSCRPAGSWGVSVETSRLTKTESTRAGLGAGERGRSHSQSRSLLAETRVEGSRKGGVGRLVANEMEAGAGGC